MASSTRATISGETVGCPLITRETVLMLTRARAATSCMIGSRRATAGSDNVSLSSPEEGPGLLDCFAKSNSPECSGHSSGRVLILGPTLSHPASWEREADGHATTVPPPDGGALRGVCWIAHAGGD